MTRSIHGMKTYTVEVLLLLSLELEITVQSLVERYAKGGITVQVLVRLLGTMFTNAITCFEPGLQ
jgi:hypothetical protein